MSISTLGLPEGCRARSAGKIGGERSARVRLVAEDGSGDAGACLLLMLLLFFLVLGKEVFCGYLDGFCTSEGETCKEVFTVDGLIELILDRKVFL